MILYEEKNYQTLQIEVCKFFGWFIFNLFSLTLTWQNISYATACLSPVGCYGLMQSCFMYPLSLLFSVSVFSAGIIEKVVFEVKNKPVLNATRDTALFLCIFIFYRILISWEKKIEVVRIP